MMLRPRISMAGLMSVAFVLALNCAAARHIMSYPYWSHGDYRFESFTGTLAMSNILGISVSLTSWNLWRRGRVEPFLVGFLAFSVLGALLFLGSLEIYPALVLRYLVGIDESLLDSGYDRMSRVVGIWAADYISLVVLFLAVALPQLIFSLAGGWLGRKCGVALAIEPAVAA